MFFTIHDPTTKDRQGADVGPQYRSIILYHSPEQKADGRAGDRRPEAKGIWHAPIVTEVVPLETLLPGRGLPPGLLRAEPAPALLPDRDRAQGRQVPQGVPGAAQALARPSAKATESSPIAVSGWHDHIHAPWPMAGGVGECPRPRSKGRRGRLTAISNPPATLVGCFQATRAEWRLARAYGHFSDGRHGSIRLANDNRSRVTPGAILITPPSATASTALASRLNGWKKSPSTGPCQSKSTQTSEGSPPHSYRLARPRRPPISGSSDLDRSNPE